MDSEEEALVYNALVKQVQAELDQIVKSAAETVARPKEALDGVVVVDGEGRVLLMTPAAEQSYGVRMVDAAGRPLALEADPAPGPSAVVRDDAGNPLGTVSLVPKGPPGKLEREFVAHVTHELRAPLSAIRAALELLQTDLAGESKEDAARIFKSALRSADRLDGLIKSILDYSKIESGQMSVHPVPTDPGALLADSAESLRPWCIQKRLALEVAAEPGLPKVLADPGRVTQAIINLMGNAIKFTPAGGRITVRARRGNGPDSGFVVLSVSDTGPGIAPEDQARLFQKFVQVGEAAKSTTGTGLGLAISKALIEMQKGRVWIESAPGQGATFLFSLPVA